MAMSDVNLIFQSNTLKGKQFINLYFGDMKGNIQNHLLAIIYLVFPY
jgi:hypothetical protein